MVIFMALLAVASFAISKDSINAVTMVSYEQGYLDSEATMALKNNTDKDIYNVAFRITYMDMSGKELDYEDCVCEVDIAPGMTKKVDLEAYEHSRNYSYYKSEAAYSNPHKFKVKFELIDINVPDAQSDTSDGAGSVTDILWVVAALVSLSIFIGVYVLVGVMARSRNRSAAAWVFVSFFITPIISIVLLLCIGKVHDDD